MEQITLKLVVVDEANVEKLVEINQLLTNVNNLLKPSTISTDKVELVELSKDSILPTGFRFIDLFIMLDVFSLLASPNYSTANTLKLQDIDNKKKGYSRFMQIKCGDCEFKHSFYTSPQRNENYENQL